ncbi:HNH endonuclease [Streptomyces sp. NPDC049906]|uniref:HNH endonuclease n=1 Tax=Streptomyces sp. NPDC049906 TaxID=3155656 RepID=UPI0034290C4E
MTTHIPRPRERRTRRTAPLLLALAPLLVALVVAPAPPAHASVVLQLEDALSTLPTAEEDRTGYAPEAFPHWNAGADPVDGCDTHREVLIAEAVEAPLVGPGCTIHGGTWTSSYDDQTVTGAGSLTVDHLVPLAEAWGSGASAWTAARREAYANDQDAPTTLTVATTRTVHQKAEQDVADWLPLEGEDYCRYLGEWVATKHRWSLSVDEDELETLKLFADNACEETVVIYTPAE